MSDRLHDPNESNRLTTISISKHNYDRLKSLGYTSDSFNDVLGRILDDIYAIKREDED